MKTEVQNKKFNKRAFISVAVFLSALFLPFSGIMNHKLQFAPLTAERHFWMSVHNSAAIIFVLFANLHIYFNWRTLINYATKVKGILFKKEALAAIATVIIIVCICASHAFHAE